MVEVAVNPTTDRVYVAEYLSRSVSVITGLTAEQPIHSGAAGIRGMPQSVVSSTTKAPMPTARSELAAGVVNKVLYAVGGGGLNGVLNTVEASNPR